MKLLRNAPFIDGKWNNYTSQTTFEVVNPADSSVVAEVVDCGEKEVSRAVNSAHSALDQWKGKNPHERADLLRKWYDLMLEYRQQLGEIMTLEQGKPIGEAIGEIQYAASFVRWYSEEAIRTYGETIPAPASQSRFVTIRQPVGVVAGITPWNFPSAMITRKAAPALAAGCTFVAKPAEDTPLSALALAVLAEKAGIPHGVFNVVPLSNPELFSEVIFSDDRIRKISFTGSTTVGKMLMKSASSSVKKISLELGGNAPFIVFEDADIAKAIKGLMTAKFRNSGQACIAANRIYVHEKIKPEFIAALAEKIKFLKVGSGMDKETQIGPLINAEAMKKVQGLMNDALDKGAKKIWGESPDGLFFYPTLLDHCTEDMQIFENEIFGPLATVYSFSNYEEVIQSANNTPFGLAAYVYSQNVARCWKAAEDLEYGMVGINSGFISDASAPFGGIKQSGIGREGSKYGIDEYLEIKYMSFGGIK